MDTGTQSYSYKLFDLMLVHELFKYQPQLRPDLYIDQSWNNEQDAIRQAITEGYRWVRSDGMVAVFEKMQPAAVSHINMLVPRHIAAQAITLVD